MPQFMTLWTPRRDTPQTRFVPERSPGDRSAKHLFDLDAYMAIFLA
jgi:hypothetical protein